MTQNAENPISFYKREQSNFVLLTQKLKAKFLREI